MSFEEGDGARESRRKSTDGRDRDSDAQYKMKIELDGSQQQAPSSSASQAGPPAYFFSPTEEKNLDLSGANILSPAVSRQGSPGVERRRRELPPLSEDRVGGEHDGAASDDADACSGSGCEDGNASASTDSFAVVDHEPLASDAGAGASSGAGLRRRAAVSEESAGTRVQQQQQ